MADKMPKALWFSALTGLVVAAMFLLAIGILLMGVAGVFISEGISAWNAAILLLGILLVVAASIKVFMLAGKHARKAAFMATLVFLGSISVAAIGSSSLSSVSHDKFRPHVDQVTFDLAGWQVREFSVSVADTLVFWDNPPALTEKEQAMLVLSYLDAAQKEAGLSGREFRQGLSEKEYEELAELRQHLGDNEFQARKILAEQLEAVLRSEGVVNPWNESGIFFPRVEFRVVKLPRRLVVAYRDRLEEYDNAYLDPDLRAESAEVLEDSIDEMGYSTLVTGIGGLSTIPSMVVASSPQRTIEVIVHEWTHHYIAFTPLGRAQKTTELRVMEETLASILDKEISQKIWNEYYSPYIEVGDDTQGAGTQKDDRIDFNEAMREIRAQVEEYLSQGKVEEAERYMAQKRDWLESEGHYIRKLNQAYLTFHGFYATGAYRDANGGIGRKLQELRATAPSLKEFLELVGTFTSAEDLDEALR